MTKNDKNKTISEILEDLSKIRNDIDLIEDNIKKLMKGKFPIQRLIYYLDKCNPIMLLKIKSNLENYKDLSKFKRSVLFPNVVLYASIWFSTVPVILHYSSGKDYWPLVVVGVIFLASYTIVHLVEKYVYRKNITGFENYIEVVLYLVDFMLENKKSNLNEYSKKLYKKNKKAPVNNTSAEK